MLWREKKNFRENIILRDGEKRDRMRKESFKERKRAVSKR